MVDLHRIKITEILLNPLVMTFASSCCYFGFLQHFVQLLLFLNVKTILNFTVWGRCRRSWLSWPPQSWDFTQIGQSWGCLVTAGLGIVWRHRSFGVLSGHVGVKWVIWFYTDLWGPCQLGDVLSSKREGNMPSAGYSGIHVHFSGFQLFTKVAELVLSSVMERVVSRVGMGATFDSSLFMTMMVLPTIYFCCLKSAIQIQSDGLIGCVITITRGLQGISTEMEA